MKISARCEYACRAMVELARHEEGAPLVSAARIARQHSIPEKYLIHVLLTLKRAGLVRSVRGVQGGYALARPAADITLLDIVTTMEGPLSEEGGSEQGGLDALSQVWRRVAIQVVGELQSWSLRRVLDAEDGHSMFYI